MGLCEGTTGLCEGTIGLCEEAIGLCDGGIVGVETGAKVEGGMVGDAPFSCRVGFRQPG